MTATLSRLSVPSANGSAVASPRRKAKKKSALATVASADQVKWARVSLTVALGVSIPLLSLALSHLGGSLIAPLFDSAALSAAERIGTVLGGASLALCCTVLAVSLSHLADAIGDITRSPLPAAWALAVAVDLSLVTCELIHSAGRGGVVSWSVLLAVTTASAALNVWAFLRHGR